MKCIKLGDGSPIRVQDAKAHELVKAGKAVYCSKSEWKAVVRK